MPAISCLHPTVSPPLFRVAPWNDADLAVGFEAGGLDLRRIVDAFLKLGMDGLFSDQSFLARKAIDAYVKR